jgi:hypothetical protein
MTITRSGKISDTFEEVGNINWQLLTHTTATPQARFDTLIRDDQGDPEQLPTVENNQAEKRRGMDDSTY